MMGDVDDPFCPLPDASWLANRDQFQEQLLMTCDRIQELFHTSTTMQAAFGGALGSVVDGMVRIVLYFIIFIEIQLSAPQHHVTVFVDTRLMLVPPIHHKSSSTLLRCRPLHHNPLPCAGCCGSMSRRSAVAVSWHSNRPCAHPGPAPYRFAKQSRHTVPPRSWSC